MNGARTWSASKRERRSSPSKKTTPPWLSKLAFDDPKSVVWDAPPRERPTTPPQDGSPVGRNEQRRPSTMRGGYNIAASDLSLRERNNLMIPPELEDDSAANHSRYTCDSENNVKFVPKQGTLDSDKNAPKSVNSNPTRSVLGENVRLVSQTNCKNSTTESRWLTTTPRKVQLAHTPAIHHVEVEMMDNVNCRKCSSDEDEMLPVRDGEVGAGPTTIAATTVATTADDPNVLIKHSSDPYSDFRLSMVTMIEEEGLQVV